MIDVFHIGWAVNNNIQALTTRRSGGASEGVYATLNLGDHVDDYNDSVSLNRSILRSELNLPSEPKWLNQIHSTNIVLADQLNQLENADGAYSTQNNSICAVLTADCLPIFIADPKGLCVGVFHAGWRGLANGILDNAVKAMSVYSNQLVAAVGPAISQISFEVGCEVRQIFIAKQSASRNYFIPSQKKDHYYADLYGLAKMQLNHLGVDSVWLPESVCTYQDSEHFYSYRRDGQTGRMASLIWISH